MSLGEIVVVIVYLFPLHMFMLRSDASLINKTAYVQDIPSLPLQNSNICTQNQPYLWCLTRNYKKEDEPWKYRHLTESSLPWNYDFQFYINDVHEIDERSQHIKISMYLDITWQEPRLRTNTSAHEWDTADYISISTFNSKYFWYPADLEMYGVQASPRQLFMNDLSGILITKQQDILYSLRLNIAFSCQMDFNRYPFDSQECPFRVSSYYNDDKLVTCSSNYSYFAGWARNLQYTIRISEMASKYRTSMYNGYNYSTCGFTISYSRSKTQLFFQVYLTAGMLVIVSWTSFIINPHIVPGRMGLLVTLLLVLVNIFNSFKNSSPPSTNLNALDVYLMICISHVFCALMQYAVVLFLGNLNIGIANVSCHKEHDDNQSHSTRYITRNQYYDKIQHQQPMSTFDLTSLVVFPLLFIFCLIIYILVYVQTF